MNDATELESSLAGTIDFFQNMRRKLGALEAETGAQHELLRTVVTSVASFQQDRQADRQTLATLTGNVETQTAQLARLQTDIRLLDEQLDQVEALVSGLQQDRQQAQQTLATLATDLQTQTAGNAREIDGLVASLQTSDQEIKAVRERVTALESRLESLDQTAQSITGTLADLSATIERQEQEQISLGQAVEANNAIGSQLQTQQTRLDELADSSSTLHQELQTVRQGFSHLLTELETQRHALAETVQTRQELQKHQDRQKYLETLINKVSADTSSTRQILNVLQSDLAIQSDTLRELDQTWREGLTTYQERLSHLENTIAGSGSHASIGLASSPSTALSFQEPPLSAPVQPESPFLDAQPESPFLDAQPESPFLDAQPESPFLDAVTEKATEIPLTELPIEQERIDELTTALAAAREEQVGLRNELTTALATTCEEQQELRLELTAVQETLSTQHEFLTNLRDILAQQLQMQQQRLGELESTLDTLRQTPAEAAEIDLLPLQDALTNHAGILDRLQKSVEQQLQAQHQRLDDLESALSNLSQVPTPALEIADLQPLHSGLAEQAETLEQLQWNTQQQFGTLTTTIDNQRAGLQEITDRIGNLQYEIEQIQQQTLVGSAADQHARAELDDTQAQESRQDLEALQEAVTTLETRLTGQAQAFSSNFEQFQGLSTDLQALQQHIENLESSRRLGIVEQVLAAQGQTVAQLTDDLQQIKQDSQQLAEIAQNDTQGPKIAELTEQLDRQQEQLTDLSAVMDTIRTDSKATQEKVLNMAANVAQRIHEFQNQLLAAKTAQGEQLQDLEQKLILLQAAVETMETQRKPRRWFSMPATFTTIAFTVGAAFL
ncbi:MAG: hypothetical protein LM549_10015, partial [Candidatus Competibacter sp.]|nr:hypothetical protein [Candidatus Competibacter sp.]